MVKTVYIHKSTKQAFILDHCLFSSALDKDICFYNSIGLPKHRMVVPKDCVDLLFDKEQVDANVMLLLYDK